MKHNNDGQPVSKLRQSFSKNGIRYNLIERREHSAVFSGSMAGRVVTFEAISIRVAYDDGKYTNKPHFFERYPSSEEWGTRAWSYTKIEPAIARMVTEDRNERERLEASK